MTNDKESLSHTKWRCKYHIVFAPKYRRQQVYRRIKTDIGKILRQLCEVKKVEILEAEACPDHIHMLVSIPPYISVSQFMGYLKGKNSRMIFDRHAKLKYKYGQCLSRCLYLTVHQGRLIIIIQVPWIRMTAMIITVFLIKPCSAQNTEHKE